jgi:hypothetical protein
MPQIPTTRFQDALKQMNTQHWSGPLRDAFSAFFPRFFDKDEFDWDQVPGVDRIRSIEKVVLSQPLAPRRFGGVALDRGRYFTVCSDAFGEDAGTLVNELHAYRDIVRTGPVEFTDLGLQGAAEVLGVPFARCQEIRAVIFEPERVRSILERIGHDTFRSEEGLAFATVAFPYTVSAVELRKVVDLRDPNVRVWFAREFSKPNDYWVWPESAPDLQFEPPTKRVSPLDGAPGRAPIPQSFADMLPTILNPVLGAGGLGGVTLQAIGDWLGNHGVDALIYPSARSDAFVEYEKGNQTHYGGWCLVNLRRYPRKAGASYINFDSNPWCWVALPVGVTVREGEKGTHREGSLAIEGIKRRNASQLLDQIDSLRAAEKQLGCASAVLTKSEAFALGTYTLRWLTLLLSGSNTEDVTFAAQVARGLMLRNGHQYLSAEILDASNRLTADGDVMAMMTSTLKVCDALKEEHAQTAEFGNIIDAAVDLELALIALDGFSRQGQVGLTSPVEAPGLRALALPTLIAAQVDAFLGRLATPGSNIAACIADGVILGSSLERYYQEHE